MSGQGWTIVRQGPIALLGNRARRLAARAIVEGKAIVAGMLTAVGVLPADRCALTWLAVGNFPIFLPAADFRRRPDLRQESGRSSPV